MFSYRQRELHLTRIVGRARIVWGILGTITGMLLIAILFQQLRPLHPDHDIDRGLSFSSRADILNAPIPDIAKEAILNPIPPDIRKEVRTVQSVPVLEDDERLRIFDEL